MFHVMEYLTDVIHYVLTFWLSHCSQVLGWYCFFDITSKSEGVGLRLVALFKCVLASDPLQLFFKIQQGNATECRPM